MPTIKLGIKISSSILKYIGIVVNSICKYTTKSIYFMPIREALGWKIVKRQTRPNSLPFYFYLFATKPATPFTNKYSIPTALLATSASVRVSSLFFLLTPCAAYDYILNQCL